MLIVVSPAKALDFESPLPTKKQSQPEMLDRSKELVGIMAGKSPDDLSSMMSISANLAELNHERFQDWTTPFTTTNARPAVLAFDGDTYTGLDAPNSFGERDYTHAQKVLRILSGLHGVLRPLDLIQPYRLEMGSKVEHDDGGDLYSYWGDDVTDRLNEALADSPGAKVLVNLASNEYFSVVQPERFDGRIISPRFLDARGDGDFKIVSFFAKQARGAMAGWIIRERITSIKALTDFDANGYRYDADRSTADEPAFIRRNDA
ncbi:MAG: peroxide stress protein YaaA [Ilumatobacter sp.]|uniref:peroxide stress protein YaaA n=1 Tax=Ilumatobacter sp. TaxID=1967498 RepID=UPI003C75C3C3